MELGKLPEGWAWTTVAELGKVVSGGTPSTKEASYWGGDIAWISPSDLTGYTNKFIARGAKSISASGLQNSSATVMPAGSIHFSSRAPIGYTVISSRSMTTNQGFKSLVPADGVFNEYIYYYFKSAKQLAESVATGTTFKEISGSAFSKMPVPLPPTAEQHRIVAKIEELFSELDQGVASLNTAREQLKVYRQSLLKNAFEGKLTAIWRAAHADQLETAAVLQQRIASERQTRYQQQLADWQTAGQTGPKPKPHKPLPPLTAEELAELPELPAGWGWLRIDEVVAESLIGLDRGAKDQTPEAPGIPYVKMNNVSMDGHVFTNKLVYIQATSAELNKFALEEGDILFNTRNSRELVGKSGIVRKLLGPTVYNNNLMRIRVSQSVDPLFLSLQMTGGNFKKALERAKKGTTNVAAVYAKDFFPLPVAVACSNEQKQVVDILESKLSEADQLDQTLATALQQADALRQSILKKAFSGQLVEQGKNDEPATALLERIRAARCTEKPVRRGRSARSPA
ncbi:MAG: restriction endonuclease subunit S [Dechloromonas sp.]|nr:restriction endonuclease subunit S [Dechloromonas sp.]